MNFTIKNVRPSTYDDLLARYERGNISYLHQAYDKPSARKKAIFKEWNDFIGTGYYSSIKIVGYNCNHFSIMFVDLDSGDIFYITHANNYRYINPYN